MSCLAVKKKGSSDRCVAKPLSGCNLCGRHAKMKTIVLWADANVTRVDRLPKLQGLVRGWLLRKRIRLAGPGALCRKNLTNDEDLVTCVEKDRQHPLRYFAFEENGKIWWFDFETLWKWVIRSYEPVNPYTKVPLSTSTRRRLRDMWYYSIRNRESPDMQFASHNERVGMYLNILCQTFADNGFVDVRPNTFSNFGRSEYSVAFVLLGRDIETIYSEKDPNRARAIRMCERMRIGSTPEAYVLRSLMTFIVLLSLHRDPYMMAFTVMSALYRC